jgi:hypothetical protein
MSCKMGVAVLRCIALFSLDTIFIAKFMLTTPAVEG